MPFRDAEPFANLFEREHAMPEPIAGVKGCGRLRGQRECVDVAHVVLPSAVRVEALTSRPT